MVRRWLTRRFRDLPVRQKLNRMVLLVVISGGVFALAAETVQAWLTARHEAESRLEMLADLMSANTAPALVFDDRRAAQENLRSLGAVKEVVYAEVARAGNSIFASYRRTDLEPPLEPGEMFRALPYVTVTQPIAFEGERIGRITVVQDLGAVYRELGIHALLVAVVVIVVGAISLLIFGWLRRFITEPVATITAAAHAIGEGDLSGRVPVESRDEFGTLAAAFNKMIDDLQRTTVSRDYVDNIVRSMTDSLMVLDSGGRIRTVNVATVHLLGYDRAEDLVGRDAAAVIDGDQPFRIEDIIEQEAVSQEERRYRHRDGTTLPVAFSGSVMRDHLGGVMGIVCVAQDISERKRMERELQRLATRDPLTNLYNRRELERRLQEDVARAARYGQPLSLFMLDIDHFKAVNDNFGHAAGDEVLRELAEHFRQQLREVDYAGRYGGEEFVVVMPETGLEDGTATAERLCASIRNLQFAVGDNVTLQVTASLGVANMPEHAEDMEKLVRLADEALYRAKKEGRNRVCVAWKNGNGNTASR